MQSVFKKCFILDEMALNKTLQVMNRTLDTVFQKQSGTFLSAPLDGDKVNIIGKVMGDYKTELGRLRTHVREIFDMAAPRGYGDRTYGICRDMMQDVGILKYNFKHAIEPMMAFEKPHRDHYSIEVQPYRKIENIRKAHVEFQFSVLKERCEQLETLLKTPELQSLSLGDTSEFLVSITSMGEIISVLEQHFLDVCHENVSGGLTWHDCGDVDRETDKGDDQDEL